MAASSSTIWPASAGVSSIGSRRPEELRQWTQARLQAYVSSQVRQMGASSPRVNRWRRGTDAGITSGDIDDLGRGQSSHGAGVLRALGLGNEGDQRGVGTLELFQRLHQLDQGFGLQEDEPPGVVVIGQRAERFLP